MVVIVAVVLGIGAVNGVGPLAQVTPPDKVTDPREMLARSLQALIDASSVHIEATLGGQVPGALVGQSATVVVLDGTQASLDLRPQDARTHLFVTSEPLGIDLESLSRWDALAYRQSGGTWASGSLASVVAGRGIDANPLTLVKRLREWLAAPGAPVPAEADVPCDAPSGRCRQVRLSAGAAPGSLLLTLFPASNAAAVGPTTTDLLLDTDVMTLRPLRLLLVLRNAEGTLNVQVDLEATKWDWPVIIPDPPGS